MKKKIPAIALAMVLAVSLLAGCGKKDNKPAETPSETYTGTLSAGAHATKDAAVEAFLAEEMSAPANDENRGYVTATLTDYTAQALTADEIAALPLADEQREGLTAAEKVKVQYNEIADLPPASSNIFDGDDLTVTAYILTYGNEYRYFSSVPEVGEPLTKSYYASVFAADKYKNFTMFYSVTKSSDTLYATMHLEIKSTADMYHALWEVLPTDPADTYREFYDGYMCRIADNMFANILGEKNEQGVIEYKAQSPNLTETSAREEMITNMKFPLLNDFALNDTDNRYFALFKKTATGFTMRDEKTTSNIEITVVDGRLSKIVETDEDLELTAIFSDFGTTTLTLPKEVQEALPAA